MNRKLFCYALPAFYMAALSLYGQRLLILPVTIVPGKVSPIVIDTFTGVACSLNATGDSGTSHGMTLYANDQGQVRFYVQAKAESIAPAKLGLQCNSGTQTVNYTIEISANAASTPTGATLAAETGYYVRPPLTGNPLAPSQAELGSNSYPMRPDPVQAPEAYATWLRMVTTPTTLIRPKLIEQPHRFHAAAAPSQTPPRQPVAPATAYSQYWSGLVLYQDPRTVVPFQLPPYDVVSAEWYVPAVTGAPDGDVEASAFWAGMDGWDFNQHSLRDVLQAGTEQDVFTVAYGGIQFTITNYYAWAEFFPSSEQLISNFNVGPGDHLVVQVYPTNGNGVDLNGFYGYCYMQNLTTGYAVQVSLNSSRIFSGNSAEWVMERPVSSALEVSRPEDCCETQYLGSLANYSAATMLSAYAMRADSTVVNASGNLNSLNVTMTTLSDQNSPILSEVVPLNDTSMVFRWKGFK